MMCVTWLLSLIRHLYLIGVCLGEHQRTKIKTCFQKKNWTTFSDFTGYSTLNIEHYLGGPKVKASTTNEIIEFAFD